MNTSEFLSTIREQGASHLERLPDACRSLSNECFNGPPAPFAWNPAQIVDHVVLANSHYLPEIERLVGRAARAGGDPVVRHTWGGKLIIKFAGPDRDVPPPGSVLLPRKGAIARGIVDLWRGQQEAFLKLTEQATGSDLMKHRMRSPFAKFLRLNLADALEIWTVHTERHVRQIEERVS